MSTNFRDKKKFATVHGKQMAYIEEGTGDPIVFLHGNPTSSYLWRNVMPHLAGKGRLIAPDLIGMGDSDMLDNSGPDSYAFVEQRKYLVALLEQLGVTENVTLVIHDWGSGLGFHWAHMHPDAVKGIAFMEAIVGTRSSWDEFPERARETFQALRSPAGEDMVLQKNLFVEGIFPASILRKLEDEEMAEYRRPFANAGEDRRPTLTWPRQIPVAGDPADVSEIVDAYVEWLATTPTPKLFVNAEPGMLITGPVRDVVRKWPNLTEVTVPGLHFIQEDSPDEIGEAIRDWHANL
ncbi:haloalkane dehalogenase [uncultured Sulfitobacter sp.]|uniref:haloalkane dehalogenase n=1 Tax=uncultured Sulfitobacter sp. TaxID=191468 RepID=UPI0030DAB670